MHVGISPSEAESKAIQAEAGWKRCKPWGLHPTPPDRQTVHSFSTVCHSFTLALALIKVPHRAIHGHSVVLHLHSGNSASIHADYRLPTQVRGGRQEPI